MSRELLQRSSEAISSDNVLEQLGGWAGFIESTLPIFFFVSCNAVWGLRSALIVSVTVAAFIFLVRLVLGRKLMPAISGLLVVGLCSLIAYRMGDAKGYFAWGIWLSGVYGTVALLSIIIRWPLIGVLWNALNSQGQSWQKDQTTRRWYALATGSWVIVFSARVIVQQWLYMMDEATLLGITRIIMGWPLALLAVIVTIWAIRHSRDTVPSPK